MTKDTLIRLSIKPAQPGVCKGCGRRILWMETLNGKAMPMNEYAMPRHVDVGVQVYSADDAHWASCPKRAQFDRKSRA